MAMVMTVERRLPNSSPGMNDELRNETRGRRTYASLPLSFFRKEEFRKEKRSTSAWWKKRETFPEQSKERMEILIRRRVDLH
jgi:hypothetical protein